MYSWRLFLLNMRAITAFAVLCFFKSLEMFDSVNGCTTATSICSLGGIEVKETSAMVVIGISVE